MTRLVCGLFVLFSVSGLGSAGSSSSVVLSTLKLAPCATRCVAPLLDELESLFRFKNTTAVLRRLCRAYDAASRCAEHKSSCLSADIFKTATSGLQELCHERASTYRLMEPCIARHADALLQNCSWHCHAPTAFASLLDDPIVQAAATSSFPNYFALINRLGPACSSFSCAVSCGQRALNKVCRFAGSFLTDVGLRLLDHVASLLQVLPQRSFVLSKIASDCRPLLSPQGLLELRAGMDAVAAAATHH